MNRPMLYLANKKYINPYFFKGCPSQIITNGSNRNGTSITAAFRLPSFKCNAIINNISVALITLPAKNVGKNKTISPTASVNKPTIIWTALLIFHWVNIFVSPGFMVKIAQPCLRLKYTVINISMPLTIFTGFNLKLGRVIW
ncbi:MAG: hypothetical protein JWQ54_995 [Mucilaginibacter sp.]|nr:hypothetical protein [Mucilaginibacter sp.]